jgi:hypothetical protein
LAVEGSVDGVMINEGCMAEPDPTHGVSECCIQLTTGLAAPAPTRTKLYAKRRNA